MTDQEIAELKAERDHLIEQTGKLQDQINELQAELDAARKTEAQAVVAKAAKEGRIAPAPEVQEKWVNNLLANPDSKELLLAMEPNPALVKQHTTQTTDPDAEGTTESPQALMAKYKAITDREEQRAFFAKHSKQLRAAHDAGIVEA